MRCLTVPQKLEIIKLYKDRTLTQRQLANKYEVSDRTINRVLIEVGIATPIARLKGDAYRVMQVLGQYGLDVKKLDHVLRKYYSQNS